MMDPQHPERRHHPRHPYMDNLFLRTLDPPIEAFACQTLEISPEGLRVLADHALAPGRPVQLWLKLATEPGTFLLRGQVRWCQPSKTGFTLGVAIDAEQGDGRDWKALLLPLASLLLTEDAD